MIYLAANNSGVFRLKAEGFPVGMMFSPEGFRVPVRGDVRVQYAVDNGLFHPFGEEPKPACDRAGLYWTLRKCWQGGFHKPMFAVIPDVPYRAEETIALARSHIHMLWSMFPHVSLALAVQNGMTPKVLDEFGVQWVFVAGDDAWKDSTMAEWTREAHARGMKCHVARVNDRRRLMAARDCGADSADGTGIWRGDRKQKQRVLSELVQLLMPEVIS